MTLKALTLTYKGRGIFTTRKKLSLRSGEAIRVFLSPTPWTDATYGSLKLSPRQAKRIAEDPDLSVWNS